MMQHSIPHLQYINEYDDAMRGNRLQKFTFWLMLPIACIYWSDLFMVDMIMHYYDGLNFHLWHVQCSCFVSWVTMAIASYVP